MCFSTQHAAHSRMLHIRLGSTATTLTLKLPTTTTTAAATTEKTTTEQQKVFTKGQGLLAIHSTWHLTKSTTVMALGMGLADPHLRKSWLHLCATSRDRALWLTSFVAFSAWWISCLRVSPLICGGTISGESSSQFPQR